MTRFIALGLLLLILRLALKNFTVQFKAAVFAPPEPPKNQARQVVSQTLVQCATCGTYVDSSRTLKGMGAGEGDVFCSEECRNKA